MHRSWRWKLNEQLFKSGINSRSSKSPEKETMPANLNHHNKTRPVTNYEMLITLLID